MGIAVTEEISLDEAQRRVVLHDGGPLIVLGGPGTGKSTVLAERWVRIARELGPHRALLLVGDRERALALRDALPWRLSVRALIEVPVHTWNALAYHLVSRYAGRLGYRRPPVLISEAEQAAAVRELLRDEDRRAWGPYGEHLTSPAFTDEVVAFCVRAARMASDEELEALAESNPALAPPARLALRYRRHLRAAGRIDRAGLVAAAAELLRAAPDVREAVRRRFSHVLVDDAQDLAGAQLQLLELIADDRAVCAADPGAGGGPGGGAGPGGGVGPGAGAGPGGGAGPGAGGGPGGGADPGAGVGPAGACLGELAARLPGARIVRLETCYRFGEAIGEVLRRLSPHDAPLSYAGPEGRAEAHRHATLSAEVEAAARTLRRAHLEEGVPYERMAVLLAQPAAYAHAVRRALDALSVPCRIAADRPLHAEPSVRALLDLCRFALDGEASEELIVGLLASPLIGMDPDRIRALRREAYRRTAQRPDAAERARALREALADDDSEAARELRRLASVVAGGEERPADEVLWELLDASSFCRRLATARADRHAAHHLEAVGALGRAVAHFVERRPGATLRDYLEAWADAEPAEDWLPAFGPGGVYVGSVASARGREWDVVCVLGVADGQLVQGEGARRLFDPWGGGGSGTERARARLDAERRALRAALTRARLRLVVTFSPGARRLQPSRFAEQAFGELGEPAPDAGPPLTLAEAAAAWRGTLCSPEASPAAKAAAACALARLGGPPPRTWWWARDWTPGAPLHPEARLTTSYSRIGAYDNCPLQYLLESVLGLDPTSTYQMRFGSLLHRILERSDPRFGDIADLPQALEAYKEEFVARHRHDYPNRVFALTYYYAGRRMIERWWHTERQRGETVAVEYAFDDLPFDGHVLRGRIDRVSKRAGGGLVLSDYKTSTTMLDAGKAAESLQLAIYYLAARSLPDLARHGEPALMELVYPGVERTDRQTGAVECGRRFQRPEQAEAALGRLREVLARAAAEDFRPSPTADCRWCAMKPLCPRYPEGREVPP